LEVAYAQSPDDAAPPSFTTLIIQAPLIGIIS
jgi:hypothetical protein